MKPRIHPVTRPVVFRDRAADVAFLISSTADSGERVEWQDGITYPVIDVETSSASHPFYAAWAPRCSTRRAASSSSAAATAPPRRPEADRKRPDQGKSREFRAVDHIRGADSREHPGMVYRSSIRGCEGDSVPGPHL